MRRGRFLLLLFYLFVFWVGSSKFAEACWQWKVTACPAVLPSYSFLFFGLCNIYSGFSSYHAGHSILDFFQAYALFIGPLFLKFLKIVSKITTTTPAVFLPDNPVSLPYGTKCFAIIKCQICISSSDLSSGSKTHISNCLLSFSKGMYQNHLKLNTFKTIQTSALLLGLFLLQFFLSSLAYKNWAEKIIGHPHISASLDLLLQLIPESHQWLPRYFSNMSLLFLSTAHPPTLNSSPLHVVLVYTLAACTPPPNPM